MYIGSTAVDINRSTATLNLPGIGTLNTHTIQGGTGTLALTTDIPTLPVKATGAELTTGTNDTKFATAKAIKDSHNVPSVLPSTDGNVLTSNGTDWISETPAAGGAVIAFPGTQVYSAAAPTSYTDLDLSAVVGSNSCFVLLKYKCTGTGGTQSGFFRTNGESDNVTANVAAAAGCAAVGDVDQNTFVYIWLFTDSAGKIEWKSNDSNAFTIYVEAYIK